MEPGRTPDSLIHNRANPVTRDVARRVSVDGTKAVVKTISPDGPMVVPHWMAGATPDHWNYWKREPLAYSGGLTEAFADDGIRSPGLLDMVELPDGSVELWLEDVVGRSGHDLDFADHVRFAGSLGRAQGSIAASSSAQESSTLTAPYVSRRWVRSYALSRPAGPAIHEDQQAWEHPVVVAGFGEERHRIRVCFGDLYRAAGAWFDLLEGLPRTLSHLDYWPNNAIAAGRPGEVDDVLIDWAFVGDGAVGEDPGNWVPDAIFDHFVDPEQFDALDSAIWRAYAAGLDSTNWGLPLELARLAMCASAVKYVWLPGLMVSTADHQGPTGYGGQPGPPLIEVFRRRAVVFGHLLDWLEEAGQLARTLGLATNPGAI